MRFYLTENDLFRCYPVAMWWSGYEWVCTTTSESSHNNVYKVPDTLLIIRSVYRGMILT